MSRIFAHTSKVGFSKIEFADEWLYGLRSDTTPTIRYGSASTRAISYKSATVKSNGKSATNYSRCVGRLTSRASGSFYTSGWHVKTNGSIISANTSLSTKPAGCNLEAGQVHVPQYLIDKVVRDARIELSDRSANILEDMAQARQTAKMGGDIYNSIAKLALPLIRRDKKAILRWVKDNAHRLPKGVAGSWLMWNYGVKPLISTLDQILTSWTGSSWTYSVRKRDSDNAPISDYVVGNASVIRSGSVERSATCELTVSGKTDSNLRYWRSLGLSGSGGGVSGLDALITAWAVIPYSFVVDWLIPVQSFLESLYWVPGLSYQTGYVGKRISGKGTCTHQYFSSSKILSGNIPVVGVELLYFQRLAYNTFPPLSSLSVNTRISPTNLINAAALIAVRG